MTWRIREITREDAIDISSWRYPEPYAIYNGDPEQVDELLDPANEYVAVVNEEGMLVGHGCFGRDARVPGGTYDGSAVDWGTGMHPDQTGQGQGLAFMRLVCEEAKRRFPGMSLRTTVATFNGRSAHVVRKLGFQQTEVFRNPEDREFAIYISG